MMNKAHWPVVVMIPLLAGCNFGGLFSKSASSIASGGNLSSNPTPSASPSPSSASFNQLFPPDAVWNTDISSAALDPESSQTIDWMVGGGNWGRNQLSWWASGNIRLSTEFYVNYVTSTTPLYPFVQNSSGYYVPDCDNPSSFPVPAGGAIEDTYGYPPGYWNCQSVSGGDCHFAAVDLGAKKLYESYGTNISNGQFGSSCAITWNLAKVYPADLRGDQCTSTDAAGLPMTAFLFSADDLAAGRIDHALRLTLPNSRIRGGGVFVHPATHASAGSGGANAPSPAPIYGARFRLKASFDVMPYSPAVQVILNALKKYGMVLSDGGDIAISAISDSTTQHKYSELGIDPSNSLQFINVADFEVVNGGSRIPLTFNCVRNGQ